MMANNQKSSIEEIQTTRCQKGQRTRTNNNLQNTTQTLKIEELTPISLKTDGEIEYSGKARISGSTCDTHRVTVKRHEHYLIG